MIEDKKFAIIQYDDERDPGPYRIDLRACTHIEIDRPNYFGAGLDLTGIWIQPRAKRVIIRTYSRWENRRRLGTIYGTRFELASADWIARLARDLDRDELLELIPIKSDE